MLGYGYEYRFYYAYKSCLIHYINNSYDAIIFTITLTKCYLLIRCFAAYSKWMSHESTRIWLKLYYLFT